MAQTVWAGIGERCANCSFCASECLRISIHFFFGEPVSLSHCLFHLFAETDKVGQFLLLAVPHNGSSWVFVWAYQRFSLCACSQTFASSNRVINAPWSRLIQLCKMNFDKDSGWPIRAERHSVISNQPCLLKTFDVGSSIHSLALRHYWSKGVIWFY